MIREPAFKGRQGQGQPVRILVLEDDPLFAELLQAQLRRMPEVESRLEVVGTLAEARARLAAETFGMVFADLDLPDSKGLDTIKALGPAERVVIVLTGNPDPALRAAALDCGAYDFLSKDRLSAAALERLVRLAAIQSRTFRSLRETEERFRSLVVLSSDWYWEQDEELRFTHFEGGASMHADHPAKVAIGKRRWELEGIALLSGGWDEHRALLAARRPFRNFEYSITSVSGERRFHSASGEPVYDAAGRFRGYRGIASDITARRNAEEELRRFRGAMDTSPDMILLVEYPSLRLLDMNSTACRLLGYSREELLAMGPQDILPISGDEMARTYERMIADPSSVTGMRSYYRCKDGSRLPFESTRRVMRSGDTWIVAVISRDIRQSMASDQALRDSETRFRGLTALSSDWYWEQDAEFRLTYMSSIEKTGLDPAAYLGKYRWDQPALNLTEADWARHRAQLERHEPFRDFEIERAGTGDGTAWISLSGEPVFNTEGSFTGYRGIGRDITVRKRSEQEVRRLGQMYRALGAANEAILRATSEQEAFERACEIAVEAGEFMLGAVFLLDPETGTLSRTAASGTAAALAEQVAPSTDASKPAGQGMIGEACRSGRPVITNDYEADWLSRRRHGPKRSYTLGSAAVFPLKVEGAIAGVLTLQHGRRHAFTDELYALLQRLADNIAFALEGFRREAKRRRAKRKLGESEQRFRSLTGLSSDLYWEQDADYRFTTFTGAAEEWLRTGREKMIGRYRWDEHYFNMSEQAWAAHRADLDARRVFRDLELGRFDEAGEKIWVSVSGEPVFDGAGVFKGYRGVGRNIAARKRVAQLRELEHSIARSLAAAERLEEALVVAIRAVCEAEGWDCGRYFSPDAGAGVLRMTIAWGVDDEAVQSLIRKTHDTTYAPGQGIAGEVWQGGNPVWIANLAEDTRSVRPELARAAGMRGAFFFPLIAEGRTVAVLGFNSRRHRAPEEDLLAAIGAIGSQLGQFVQRKQAEAALRASRQLLDNIVDNVPTAVQVKEVREGGYRMVMWNKASETMYGVPRHDALGRTVYDLWPAPSADAMHAADLALVARGGMDDFPDRVAETRHRGSIHVHMRKLPLYDASGEATHLLVVADDITERKRAEERQAAHLHYQARIARFGQSALAKREPAELIGEAVQTAIETLAADAVAYLEVEPGSVQVVTRAVVGPVDAGAASLGRPQGELAEVLATGNRFLGGGAALPLAWARELRSAALIPVRGDNVVRGVLCVCWREAREFAAEELNFVEAVASVLSSGLQRIDSERRLAYLAQFDALTGLPNRALLADRFSQMIVQARRHGRPLGVLFIDLDEFKMVNDTLGHAAGDELLKEVAVRLQSAVRQGDTVARISGDEFAIVLADLAKPEDAALVAQKVIERLAATVEITGRETFVTASVGIASFPGDGGDAEALIGAADAAMYRAKQSGRNTYQFFTADLNQRLRARAQMAADLRRALEREEFTLAYQPKYALTDRKPKGAEALMRWTHPERGPVSPAEFIPVMEETGLIVQAGEWVLQRACEDLRGWQAAGIDVGSVAVNLSARQFRQPELDRRLKRIVAGAGVAPALIELEVTESHVMQDPAHAVQMLRSLCDAGMRIAIDDFGTGYSSLSYLTRFPPGSLKIDRSFVKNMFDDRGHATIVRIVIEMAHTLGFTVVAEGVETEEQANLLRLLRCELAQGFLFAKPMPAGELAKLFQVANSKS